MYLNLVLEFVPDTVYRLSKMYSKSAQRMPDVLVKLYTYQMARALANIHNGGVCHRDIKPQNLLVDTRTHQLKLYDFGSAKTRQDGAQHLLHLLAILPRPRAHLRRHGVHHRHRHMVPGVRHG